MPELKMGAKIPQQSSPSCGCSCGYTPYGKDTFYRHDNKGLLRPSFFACAHIQLADDDLTSNHIIFLLSLPLGGCDIFSIVNKHASVNRYKFVNAL